MIPLIGIFAELIFGLLSGVGKLYDLLRPKKKKPADNSSESQEKDEEGEDLELGVIGGGSKEDPAEKEDTEEDVLAELMRKHQLCGPPRFLFTIVEETVEDLASEEERKSTKLRDLLRAEDDDASVLSPIPSPVVKSLISRSPSGEFSAAFKSYSPQRSFKFSRDAEEKVSRKSAEDAVRSGVGNGGGGGQHVQVHCRSCSSEVIDVRVQVVSG